MKCLFIFLMALALANTYSCTPVDACFPNFIIEKSDNLLRYGCFDKVSPFWKMEPVFSNMTCSKYEDSCGEISKDILPGPLVGDNYILFSCLDNQFIKTRSIYQYIELDDELFDLELDLYINIININTDFDFGVYVNWNNETVKLFDEANFLNTNEYIPFKVHLDKQNRKINKLEIGFYCLEKSWTIPYLCFDKKDKLIIALDNITLTGNKFVKIEDKKEEEEEPYLPNIIIVGSKEETYDFWESFEIVFKIFFIILECLADIFT